MGCEPVPEDIRERAQLRCGSERTRILVFSAVIERDAVGRPAKQSDARRAKPVRPLGGQPVGPSRQAVGRVVRDVSGCRVGDVRLWEGRVINLASATKGVDRHAVVSSCCVPSGSLFARSPIELLPLITLTAPTLGSPSPVERTVPNIGERRRPCERAEASTAEVDAGTLPASTRGGVRAGRTEYGTTAATQGATVPSRSLGASTPPLRNVAPFSTSRLPVYLAVKENAR